MLAFLLAAQLGAPIIVMPSPELAARRQVEADRAAAERVAEVRRLGWMDCVQREKIALRSSRESVGDIATAVLSGCTNEQQVYRRALPFAFRGLMDELRANEAADTIVARARVGLREALIGFYVGDRLKRRARR